MEQDSSYTQRLIVAAILCFGVIMAWEYFFPSARPKPKPPIASGEDAGPGPSDAGTKTSTKTAIVRADTSTQTQVSPEPVVANVEEEKFIFKGEVSGKDGRAIPYELTLTNLGGGIERFILPSFFERDASNDPTDDPISLADTAFADDLGRQMAGLSFTEGSTFRLPKRPVYEVVEKSEDRVLYRFRTSEGVVIEREYSLKKDAFELELAVTVKNESKRPQSHRMSMSAALGRSDAAQAGFFMMPPPDHLKALCFTDGKVEREDQKELLKDGAETYKEGVKWVAMDRQYFVAGLIQRDGVEAECKLEGFEGRARASLLLPEIKLDPGEEKRHKFTAYLGVKKPGLLTRVDAQLEAAIDYTIFGLNLAIICEALLALMGLIHSWTGSWGAAILGLTVLMKGILFPLNQRSGKSMRAMSALKPEMESIRKKHGEDRQRQSEEIMKLYQKHSVNPASGCVPILIQMPIWFALYRALWVSVDLYQASFLWIPDLTTRDPMFILPVVLVVVMFIQQKVTPTAMDPAQQKIMLYVMPIMFGSFMIALPAGLVFYILINSLLTILQQHFINKTLGPIGGPPSDQKATA